MKKKYIVEGMSCTACSSAVERAVSRINGIENASVDLLSKTLVCDVDFKKTDEEKLFSAVKKAGFSISVKKEEKKENIIPRLVASAVFLLLLMALMMTETPLKREENALLFALIQFFLTLPVLILNRVFFIKGFKSLFSGSPNMDTLVAVGSSAGVIYGLFSIVLIALGDSHHAHNLYFDSSAMILTLVTLGKFLEGRSKNKTGDALRSLVRLAPEKVSVIECGREREILSSEVKVGDIILVRPGGRVAVDGVIAEGRAFFDTSALTGESVPVERGEGDEIFSSSLSVDGTVKIRATSVGNETTLSRIISLVEEAGATKAPIARLADKISRIFVPTVMTLAFITLIVWLLIGEGFEFALSRALSVLVISCPCALGLATPVAITVFVGKLGSEGILVKSAAFAEILSKTKTIIFDKTGTVTQGEMEVSDVFFEGVDEEFFLSLAKALEEPSSHPLALAVVKYTKDRKALPLEDFKSVSGRGVEGFFEGKKAFGGSLRFMKEKGASLGVFEEKAEKLLRLGKTLSFFALDGRVIGVIGALDKIKADAEDTVSSLKKMGIKTVLLTGDNSYTARAVGDAVGFDEVVSEVLPDDKAGFVKRFVGEGVTVMVGDGINDSPALASASVGIALGSGTDIAIDASDVILISNKLEGVKRLVDYSRSALKIIKENLFWAFFYNTLGIPLAAGVFHFAGIVFSPMIASAAMSFSSLFVVLNALRLYRK